ncbi:hypothetical protein [Curvivirga aplysinae]|uniref:hypothetical protein n=1 Tax=Curvivirga aplysinae TaxID=2529852 RepID=UPI0012BD5997|nr:hypothetical protein [Curvivirga aplysinae]MTI09091.1 hypothetical protein [Curvivirga aplysinae]
MNIIYKTFIVLFCIIGFSHIASASEYCPKKVGVLSEGTSHSKLSKIYTRVFKQLGCDVQIKKAPGQRVIKLLNDGKLDGDLLRFPVIEKKYRFDYIRSNPPILKDQIKAIYKYPGSIVDYHIPKGIVLGAIWQENYAETHKKEDMAKTILYYSYDEILTAYHNKEIIAFLSEQQVIDHAYRVGLISVKPEIHKVVQKDDVYLYLRVKFKDFLTDFNKIVTEQDPFANYAEN